jgi:outer membrane protein assembly factor BamB
VLYDASSGAIRALSPTTGSLLWQGTIGGIHWESPIVVNGVLYVTDESSHLTAFARTLLARALQSGTVIFLPLVANNGLIGC